MFFCLFGCCKGVLEHIAKTTKGRIVSPDDYKLQATVFNNYVGT